MDRDESWRAIDEQREQVAALLDGLTPEQWESPSLCDAWRVRDVGAHLSLAATAGMGEVMAGFWAARGNFDRTIRDVSIARAARSYDEIVADLRRIQGSRRLAPGTFWRDPLVDALVHAHDIADPLGIEIETPVEAAREAAEWAWRRGFPFFPARRLRGYRLVATDTEWARGTGTELRAPITQLLLLSTGRGSAAAHLAA